MNRHDIIPILVEAGADIEAKNKYDESPLFYAIQFDSIEAMRALLKAGAMVNTESDEVESPLQCASYDGSVDTVKVLIEHGATFSTDKNGNTLLHYAADADNYDVFKFLLENG